MKYLLPALVFTASCFVSGCGSLENPLGGLFGGGRDAHVAHSQTGEYGSMAGGASAPERRGDGRYFDPVKNQWVDAPAEGGAAARSKARPASPPVAAGPAPQPAVAPLPQPSRASGVYNPSTGQIDWGSYDPASAPAAQSAPAKRWWWPF